MVRSSGLSLERLRAVASRLVKDVDFSKVERAEIVRILERRGITQQRFNETRTMMALRWGWM